MLYKIIIAHLCALISVSGAHSCPHGVLRVCFSGHAVGVLPYLWVMFYVGIQVSCKPHLTKHIYYYNVDFILTYSFQVIFRLGCWVRWVLLRLDCPARFTLFLCPSYPSPPLSLGCNIHLFGRYPTAPVL